MGWNNPSTKYQQDIPVVFAFFLFRPTSMATMPEVWLMIPVLSLHCRCDNYFQCEVQGVYKPPKTVGGI